MDRRVVVCGGTGYIGRHLGVRLQREGYQVMIVSRHPAPGQSSYDDLPKVLDGSFAVVNLAGRSIATNFTGEHRHEIEDSRVVPTCLITQALKKCANPPSVWIQASATGYYGNRGDEQLTASSAPGKGFLTDVCLDWEEACQVPDGRTRRVIIRFGLVCSADGGAVADLIKLTKWFLGGQAGDGKQWVSWIHVEDLVGLMLYAIEHETPEILIGAAPNPVQNKDMMSSLRHMFHRPWSPPVPACIIRWIGTVKGPDACLILDSCRAIPLDIGYVYRYPTFPSMPLNRK